MIATDARNGGIVLTVLAHASAKRDAILGERAGSLRVAVTAPPEKGKANAAIQSVLAEAFDCNRNQITLVSGATARRKKFRIEGITSDELSRRLAALVDFPKSPRPER
jgi:uncharacterized protein (TIGR00251 family)